MIFSEGSGVNNSVFGKVQDPIKMFLEKRGEAFEQVSVIEKVFSMQKSTHYGERLTTMTAMEGFKPVGENGAYPDDMMQEGFSKFLAAMTWKDKFSISQEMIDDAVTMDMKKQPEAFLAGFHRTRETFGAALLGGAVTGAANIKYRGMAFDTTGADDLPLFSNAHPYKVKTGVQCNVFSDAVDADAIGKMETTMHMFEGDTGEILDVTPDTIIIPDIHSVKKAVFAALGADKDPDTANNGSNYTFGRFNIIVWNYLNKYITAGTAPWIMMDSKYNETYGGAVWLDRKELTVRSTIDEDTDANVWRGNARFIAGFNDWRAFCVGGVSSASALVG